MKRFLSDGNIIVGLLESGLQRILPGRSITLQSKLTAVVIAGMILSFCMTATVAMTMLYLKARQDIHEYQHESETRIKQTLKNYVHIAYSTMDAAFHQAHDRYYLERAYGPQLRNMVDVAESVMRQKAQLAARGDLSLAEAQRLALEEIRQMRYNNGTGYLWINSLGRPFPSMIMHPTHPYLNGRILDDKKFNCTKDGKKNLFVSMVDICREKNEGFVEYQWPKPVSQGLSEERAKLSYVRRFGPWGWMIGTGMYIEDAEKAAKERIKNEIKDMRYDDGTGYIWINDTTRPVPKMVMHPISPELDGHVLDDPKYNCAMGQKRNLFAAFVDVCGEHNEGFVDYRWPKPTPQGITPDQPKLSYVRIFRPLNWIIGTGVYIDDIQAIIKKKKRKILQQQIGMMAALILPIMLVSVVLVFVMVVVIETVLQTIFRLGEKLKDISAGEGDLTKRIEAVGNDEVGDLAKGFNVFLEKLSNMIGRFKGSSMQVDQTAREMGDIKSSLIRASHDLDVKVKELNGEIKQLNHNMTATAAASDVISENLSGVDAAVTQFSATFQNITDNANVTSGLVNDAVEVVERATQKIKGFMSKTDEIHTIVDMISQISNQTKLLALNAGIEAARAGEAGRGFSVVAEEVKKLAEKVNEAAVGIREILANIQATSGNSFAEFDKIHQAVTQVNHAMTDIAAAVEEQSATTEEIASNVSESARGLMEVNDHIGDMEKLTRNIAGEVDDVKRASITVMQQSEVLSERADALNLQSEKMQNSIGRFKIQRQNT